MIIQPTSAYKNFYLVIKSQPYKKETLAFQENFAIDDIYLIQDCIPWIFQKIFVMSSMPLVAPCLCEISN